MKRILKVFYWLFTFQLFQRLERRKVAQLIGQSGLFDSEYYYQQDSEVKKLGIDPLGHYLDVGSFQGKCPNPLFDTFYYLDQYPDVAELGINPLAHYLTVGAKRGYNPHPLFDTHYYINQYPDVVESGINPLLHYITVGVKQDRNPFPSLPIQLRSLKTKTRSSTDFNRPISQDSNYQIWLDRYYPSQQDLQQMSKEIQTLEYQPLISIIISSSMSEISHLKDTINSVFSQVYCHWELCLDSQLLRDYNLVSILNQHEQQELQIKLFSRMNHELNDSTYNLGLNIAAGEFIVLLNPNDLLAPHALYEVVLLLNKHSEADFIYSDEDYIDQNNNLTNPFFKPDWCPDSFLSRMYTGHLGVYRRSLAKEIKGFKAEYKQNQEYEFLLRLTERTAQVYHIPNILYHSRQNNTLVPQCPNDTTDEIDTAKQALSEAIMRREEPGYIMKAPYSQKDYIIRYEIKKHDLVSIIIPTKNLGKILNNSLQSIFELTTYPNFEVILIDNGTTENQALEVINKWQQKEPNRLKCFPLNIPFNYSTLNNFAVQHSRGKYLLFLNNDIEVITPDWIEGFVEQSQRSSIGAVGALLLFPDDTIQHAGVIGGIFKSCGHSHKRFKLGESGYFNQLNTINNYSALTGACLMLQRDKFDEIGGFDENLAVNYNDIDLCFKLIERGYYNLYLPHVFLYHYESKSRGYDLLNTFKTARFTCESKYFITKWKSLVEHDPCYNFNLTFEREDYSIGI